MLQAVVATTKRAAWADSSRGLGAADLAMHVVLPELDGRVLAGVIAFKNPSNLFDGLAFTGIINQPEPDRIDAVADRIAALVRLQATPRGQRRIAVLLPDYPGAPGRTGYAVGLDVPASVNAMLADLAEAGYAVAPPPVSSKALLDALSGGNRVSMPVETYRGLLARLPSDVGEKIAAAWGEPEDDPDVQGRRVPLSRAAIRQHHRRACRRIAAVQTVAAPTITIHPCRRATHCSPSGFGFVMSRMSMPSSTWARTARWNGCRARPSR